MGRGRNNTARAGGPPTETQRPLKRKHRPTRPSCQHAKTPSGLSLVHSIGPEFYSRCTTFVVSPAKMKHDHAPPVLFSYVASGANNITDEPRADAPPSRTTITLDVVGWGGGFARNTKNWVLTYEYYCTTTVTHF